MKPNHRKILTRPASAALVLALITACTSVDTAHVTRTKPIAAPDQPWKAQILNQPDFKAEDAYIAKRRAALDIKPANYPTIALCFSGGGLRCATIQLGVLQGLEEKGLLKQADYLSSVSGGSYIASWYVSHLLPPGKQSVKSKKSTFHGGHASYTADRAELLELNKVNCDGKSDGAVGELRERRGFVLGKGNMNLPWLIPMHAATIPFNYFFDLGLHWKPVRGKFNLYHPSYFYESAIRRTYLTAPESLIAGQEDESDGFFQGKPHEVRLNEINPPGHSAPYLIINAAQANVPSKNGIAHRASHFELSRHSVGGPFVGYVHSDHFGFPVESVQHGENGTGTVALRANSLHSLPMTTKPLRLSWAVAASGAAVDPNGLGKVESTSDRWPPDSCDFQPKKHNPKYGWNYLFFNLLNLNLRQQNRNFAMQSPGQPNSPWTITDKLKDRTREVVLDRIKTTSNSNTLILTDGGHFENLGVYAMLQRPHVKEIWSFDTAQDGGYKFEDWFTLARLMDRTGWKITPKGGHKLPTSKPCKKPASPFFRPSCQKRWSTGPVVWIDSPVFEFALHHERDNRNVKLFLVKSSYRDDDGTALGLDDWFRNYRISGLTGKKFPHTSTGNVSFSEKDFTSYRHLGRVLAWKLFDHLDSKK